VLDVRPFLYICEKRIMKKKELIAEIERLKEKISEQKYKEFGSKFDLVRSTLEAIGMVKEEIEVNRQLMTSRTTHTFIVTY